MSVSGINKKRRCEFNNEVSISFQILKGLGQKNIIENYIRYAHSSLTRYAHTLCANNHRPLEPAVWPPAPDHRTALPGVAPYACTPTVTVNSRVCQPLFRGQVLFSGGINSIFKKKIAILWKGHFPGSCPPLPFFDPPQASEDAATKNPTVTFETTLGAGAFPNDDPEYVASKRQLFQYIHLGFRSLGSFPGLWKVERGFSLTGFLYALPVNSFWENCQEPYPTKLSVTTARALGGASF